MARLPEITPGTYRRITLVALVALCFIIVTGGAVRLTGSGLGCSDWPGCEQSQFVAPLELHPMVEFVNRVVTGLVSISIILAVLGSVRRVPRRQDLTWLALGLVGGVIGQILLGAVTVANDLAPPFVMGHFLLSLVLVGNAVVLHARASDDRPVAVAPATRRFTTALLPALALAIVAGTVVTGTGPHGGDEDARRFGFEIESVTRVHSIAVICFVSLLLYVLSRADKERAPAVFVRRARELLYVASGQAAIGWIQWFAGVPAVLVGLHILGATLTWAACCRLVLSAGVAAPAVDADRRRVEALAGSA